MSVYPPSNLLSDWSDDISGTRGPFRGTCGFNSFCCFDRATLAWRTVQYPINVVPAIGMDETPDRLGEV